MNLDHIKKYIYDNLNVYHHFIYKGSRNLIEEFDGKIIKVFPAIFIIELDNGSIKSFNYNDVIIKHLKIVY